MIKSSGRSERRGVSRWAWVVLILVLVAACTESDLSEEAATGFGLVVEEADRVIAEFPPLCEALRSEGYETRKVTFDEADNTSRRLAENACPDDIARLSAARDLEAATASIDLANIDVVFPLCAGTTTGFEATVTFTNNGTVPVGVYAAVRAETGGQLSGRPVFVVVWKLDPGASATREVEGRATGDGCGAEFNAFLADDSLTGDASGVAPASPEIASDDPAVFFPALYDTESQWWSDADASIDGPSSTEDLRSTTYADLYESVAEGTERPPIPGLQSMCSAEPHPDNPDLMVLTIQLSDRIAAGLVRRGADGGWRWLGSTVDLGAPPCP